MDAKDLIDEAAALGWSVYEDPGFINHAGPFFYQVCDEGMRFRFQAFERHKNRNGMVQGGALMTFVDRALGATARHMTGAPATVTVTLNQQFIDGVKVGEIIETQPTMIRATKQLVFMSGEFKVGSRVVCVANGIWKKIVTPPALLDAGSADAERDSSGS